MVLTVSLSWEELFNNFDCNEDEQNNFLLPVERPQHKDLNESKVK